MSNTALCLTALLLLIPIFISYKEGLHIIKDLVIATIRATIQLLILGFLLHYIFEINEKWLLVLCVLVIIINASWNTISRASPVMHHVFGYHLWLYLWEQLYHWQQLLLQVQLNLQRMK